MLGVNSAKFVLEAQSPQGVLQRCAVLGSAELPGEMDEEEEFDIFERIDAGEGIEIELACDMARQECILAQQTSFVGSGEKALSQPWAGPDGGEMCDVCWSSCDNISRGLLEVCVGDCVVAG